MKSTNTFGVHFSLRLNRPVNGKFPIYVRITVNKSRCVIALKSLVKEEDWNIGKGSPKLKNEELKQLSSYLEEVRSKLVVQFQRLQLGNAIVTAEAVKNAYLGISDKPAIEKMTLCKLVDMHNDMMKSVLKRGTMKVMIHDLHFERKNEKGFYFLNSETVTLQKENQEAITQKFAFFNQKGFSNDEAYNLMSGRPVRNTVVINDESVTRWTYIDFNAEKNKNGNYVFRNPKEDDLNFNLVTALSKLPIQNLNPQEKEAMLQGLRSGSLIPASLKVEGVWERTYLEVSPLMGKINVYDANMNKIAMSNSKIQVLPDDMTLKNVPDAVVKLLDKEQGLG